MGKELDQLSPIELHIKKAEYEDMIRELEDEIKYAEESKSTLKGEALTDAYNDYRYYSDSLEKYKEELHSVEQEINRKMNY